MSTQTKRGGFTLVEILAASVILGAAVMLMGSVGTKAMIGTRLNRHYEMAASLIERQLSLIDYLGIDAFLESDQTEGESQDLGLPFHWRVDTEYQDLDSLYLVRITVSWVDRNRPHSLTADTMLDGEALMDEGQSGGS